MATFDNIRISPNGDAIYVVVFKAGAVSDADWTTAPPIGTMVWDNTNFKLYIRTAAATWKSSAAFA